MKNFRTLAAIMFLAFAMSAFSQGGKVKQKIDRVKSLKVAFITNELKLTPEESAAFWPLYNAFEAKQRDLRKQKASTFSDGAALENLNEKEARAILNEMEKNEEELYQIRKKFAENLKGVLPTVKILKLKKAEEDFNRKLLREYRAKKKQR